MLELKVRLVVKMMMTPHLQRTPYSHTTFHLRRRGLQYSCNLKSLGARRTMQSTPYILPSTPQSSLTIKKQHGNSLLTRLWHLISVMSKIIFLLVGPSKCVPTLHSGILKPSQVLTHQARMELGIMVQSVRCGSKTACQLFPP